MRKGKPIVYPIHDKWNNLWDKKICRKAPITNPPKCASGIGIFLHLMITLIPIVYHLVVLISGTKLWVNPPSA
jgi:hypothetical protein